MMKVDETVETTGGHELTKLIAFAGIGVFRHPRTGEAVVVDFREELLPAQA